MYITKSKTSSKYVQWKYTRGGGTAQNTVSFASHDTITYEDGPKIVDGKSNWKQCVHDTLTPPKGGFHWYKVDVRDGDTQHVQIWNTGSMPSAPRPAEASLPPMNDLWDQFYDQIDLNCSDGVLLYSGILQAVPLVGGALKGVSLLNRAARRLSRSFKRQPFTTVVKSLISLDFIDRFVVAPTIDDMRKFADASDYCLRILNTAQTRNNELATAFECSQQNTLSESDKDDEGSFDYVGLRYHMRSEAKASRKLKVLASVKYDSSAIDPIKLWAARVGLSRPLDSFWDLIPFSFVLDYFTRAGDFISHAGNALSNQDALVGRIARVYGAWAMDTLSSSASYKLTAAIPGYSFLRVINAGGEFAWKNSLFSRYPVNLMQARGFWDRDGFISPSLSTTRLRTLAELIIQTKL